MERVKDLLVNRVVCDKLEKVIKTKVAVTKVNMSTPYQPYQFLKPKQTDVLYSILERKDTLAVLPTGYGKSLLFEMVPYVLENAVAIIACPLTSIIQEQLERYTIVATSY